ncbi:hypothetical protein [Parafrankia sp. BMG5.11]|uniref:hypothetical protein n=1 Tax=Parafrankia sp. BMG5.11 TaxID=222540 RepID=UPI00103B41F0|nr:hypothetical protein [Parafrankia sp. BMG5.11]TCJ39522.1 hypothetical protein E0504_10475 [Parafrankia sp. BMG5.11]
MTDQLSNRARPLTFDQAFGVDLITSQLRKDVLSKRPGHITLSGESGTGKSTLGLIYAQGSVCHNPTDAGSACNACSACLAFRANKLADFERIRCPSRGRKDFIDDLVRDYLTGVVFDGRNRVVLFDEAQALTPPAQDLLLDVLEERDWPLVCIFTLIDERDLSRPLLDRTRHLPLAVPDFAQARAYLAHLAKLEDVAAEPEAIDLIATFSRGYRSLAGWFDQARIADPTNRVSLVTVRNTLLRDRSSGILALLGHCLGARPEKALAALERMTLGPAETIDAVLQVLTHLTVRFTATGRGQRGSHKLTYLLDDDACRFVMSQFADRAAELGRTLDGLLDESLEFWSTVGSGQTSTKLEAHVIRFCLLLKYSSAPADADLAPAAQRPINQPTKSKRLLWRARDNKGIVSRRGEWLTLPQAQEFYEAATFMVQAYGVGFNSALVVDHLTSDDRASVELISGLTRQIRARLFERHAEIAGPRADFHRIVLHERNLGGQLSSQIVFALPPSLLSDLTSFLDRWEMRNGPKARLERQLSAVVGTTNLPLHWTLMRELWRGIDPIVRVDGMSVLDLLKVPPSRRGPLGHVEARRYAISASINEGQQRTAAADRMGHLSAWADRKWSRLFTAWELKEHAARSDELHRRAQRLAEIERAFPADGLLLEHTAHNAAVAAERATWPIDPHDRHRSWPSWW